MAEGALQTPAGGCGCSAPPILQEPALRGLALRAGHVHALVELHRACVACGAPADRTSLALRAPFAPAALADHALHSPRVYDLALVPTESLFAKPGGTVGVLLEYLVLCDCAPNIELASDFLEGNVAVADLEPYA